MTVFVMYFPSQVATFADNWVVDLAHRGLPIYLHEIQHWPELLKRDRSIGRHSSSGKCVIIARVALSCPVCPLLRLVLRAVLPGSLTFCTRRFTRFPATSY